MNERTNASEFFSIRENKIKALKMLIELNKIAKGPVLASAFSGTLSAKFKIKGDSGRQTFAPLFRFWVNRGILNRSKDEHDKACFVLGLEGKRFLLRRGIQLSSVESSTLKSSTSIWKWVPLKINPEHQVPSEFGYRLKEEVVQIVYRPMGTSCLISIHDRQDKNLLFEKVEIICRDATVSRAFGREIAMALVETSLEL